MSYLEFIAEIKEHFKDYNIKNKDEIIEYVLIENPKIFTYQFVSERKMYCEKCGNCCKEQKCPSLRSDKTCGHWGTPNRSDVCFEFPYTDMEDGAGLFLVKYCKYAKKVAIAALNEVFIKYGEKYD